MSDMISATKEGVHRLLDRVAELQRYQEDLRLQYATDFNFFTALTPWHHENAHTRMLAALLNPRGAHGQGTLFLRLFLQQIGAFEDTERTLDGSFNVFAQYHIPTANNPTQCDRYPDLVIEGPDQVVLIENKVRAGEGDDQVPDYGLWLASRRESRRILVFLTPDGGAPDQLPPSGTLECIELRCMAYAQTDPGKSVESAGKGEPSDYTTAISSVECGGSLRGWLDSCLSHVPLLPPVREVITQYRDLVERIGGQTVSTRERDAVATVASDDSRSFAAALAVSDATYLAKAKVQHRFWIELASELRSDFSSVQIKANSEAEIVQYLKPGGRRDERPRPGVQLLTDIQWRGESLYIDLEPMRYSDQNWLTIKLLRPQRDDAFIDQDERRIFEKAQNTDIYLTHINCWPRTFVVGRLVLNGGSQLDLSNFNPPARKLASKDERMDVIKDICQKTRLFYDSMNTIVSSLTPA